MRENHLKKNSLQAIAFCFFYIKRKYTSIIEHRLVIHERKRTSQYLLKRTIELYVNGWYSDKHQVYWYLVDFSIGNVNKMCIVSY